MASDVSAPLLQSVFNQPRLLFRMALMRTNRWAGVLAASGVMDHPVETFQAPEHESPGAHIARLCNYQVHVRAIAAQHVDDSLLRKRVKLFHPHDRYIANFLRRACRGQDRSKPCPCRTPPYARASGPANRQHFMEILIRQLTEPLLWLTAANSSA